MFREIINENDLSSQSQSQIEAIIRAKVDERFERIKMKVEAQIQDNIDLADQCDNFVNNDLARDIQSVKVGDIVTLDKLFLTNIMNDYLETINYFQYKNNVQDFEYVCVKTSTDPNMYDVNSRPRFYWDFKPSIPGSTEDMFNFRVSLYRNTGKFGIALTNVGKYHMIQQKYPKSLYMKKRPIVKQENNDEDYDVVEIPAFTKKQRTN